MNRNLNTTIKRESNNRRGEFQGCVTESFKTFGGMDVFQCCSENFAFESRDSCSWS